MTGVVRVQVEHDVHQLATGDDQAVLVRQRRDVGERPCLGRIILPQRRFSDVRHPVRRPQPLQVVGHTDPLVDDRAVVRLAHVSAPTLSNSAVGKAFSRLATHWTIASIASSRGTPLTWLRSPNLKLTAPASTSRSPATN